jgi:Leucine-rich repeat (LRR) protein
MLNLLTVHTLDLSNNELSILKYVSFSNYSRLSSLILSNNKVEEIEINAFAGLQMMRSIDLSYNRLQSFNPKIFSSNPVLETVSLSGNNLVYLPSDFPILISTSVSSLDLSSCSLTTIHSVTFSSLPSLYDLDLSSNNLQTISLSALEKVPDLRLLELNNNRWTCNCDIVEVMQWAESRREQQRAHKPVKCLEGQEYRSLWTVAGGNRSCSVYKTTELPSIVADDGSVGCPAGCSCSTVDGFVNSHAVKCSYLGLSDIPAMLNSITVHTLDLSNNEVSILKNDSFSSYSSLFTLILSYIQVEEIEINAFAGLQMMRDVDLSYNKLRSFNPKIFSSNPVLETLSLRGNNLVYLSSELPILISTSISSLDLSSCSLTTIHSITFSSLPSLYDLDLSSNNLQTISLLTLEKLPGLRILELSNNPWICNCDIVEVMQWAESRRAQQRAHKPVKCLEGQQYRTLWTMAGGNRSCSEYKTTERVVTHDREFTTDLAVTSKAEHGAAAEKETVGWNILLYWNVTTMTVFVILPITLGVAVFVSLIAVNYIVKRSKDHRTKHDKQEKYNPVRAFFSKVPLLKNQLTADITKQHFGHENRGRCAVGGTEYHVYERID